MTTPTEKPETVEDLARVALGRVRCRVPQPSYSHDDSGCEACRLQARITAALRSYGDLREREAVQKAARAVCRQCEGGERIYRKGPTRSGYWAHDDNNHDGWPEGYCKANAIYLAFQRHLPTPSAEEGKPRPVPLSAEQKEEA